MDEFVKAFGPVFVTGFAIQQLLEILNPLFKVYKRDPKTNKLIVSKKTKKEVIDKPRKKLFMGLFSLAIGLSLAFSVDGLLILKHFGIEAKVFDAIITGLVLSAGTEGANSIMKFLGYSKENQNPDKPEDETEAETSEAIPDSNAPK